MCPYLYCKRTLSFNTIQMKTYRNSKIGIITSNRDSLGDGFNLIQEQTVIQLKIKI